MKKKILRTSIVYGILAGIAITFLALNFYATLHKSILIDHLPKIKSSDSLFHSSNHRYPWIIKRGDSLARVVQQLHIAGIISNPDYLILYARLSDKQVVQAGEYWLQRDDNSLSILEKFNEGIVIVRRLTFIEGWNFSQMRNYLHSFPQFSKDESLSDSEILAASKISIAHPEGWFFPDTYRYTGADETVDILSRAHHKMRTQLGELWPLRASGLPYDEPYEALIMASIVEKETGIAAERARIAGVFVRRLQKKMRLETDPTVIYGLGVRFNGDIRRSHLREKNAYNTYKIRGLPPTPISMPGRASIEAALNPLAGNSLYFVAKGDGSHAFSDTYKEHKKAVREFQLN